MIGKKQKENLIVDLGMSFNYVMITRLIMAIGMQI